MYRYRRYRPRRISPWAVAAVAVIVLAAGSQVAHAGRVHAPAKAAAKAIAFARAQLGCPYVWGGTGPCRSGFDCSGLVMKAYASAGVSIERTSQQQWASEHHVSRPQPGDLVFFAGADGTAASPGHVAMVISPRRHLMIEAYATGVPIRRASWTGRDPVGFTRPAGGR
jgi:cell wall-associated NlpC family hydrolase